MQLQNKNSLIKSEYSRVIRKVEELSKHIEINSRIMDGIPVIKGTRIPVYVVLEMLNGGYSFQKIHKEYPSLSFKDIHASLHFASLLTTLH